MFNRKQIGVSVLTCLATCISVPALARADVAWTGSGWSVDGSPLLFPKGSQVLSLSGGYGFPAPNNDTQEISASVGYQYYFADNVAIGPQIFLRTIESRQGQHATGADFTPVIRWHYLTAGRLSLFVDIAGGIGYYDMPVPEGEHGGLDGTRFNFNAEGGPGFTYKLSDRWHFTGVVRYAHYSNGSIESADRHYSVNNVLVHFGLFYEF